MRPQFAFADQTPFECLTEEAFRRSMEVNLMSVFYSYKTVVEDMKKANWGRILFQCGHHRSINSAGVDAVYQDIVFCKSEPGGGCCHFYGCILSFGLGEGCGDCSSALW